MLSLVTNGGGDAETNQMSRWGVSIQDRGERYYWIWSTHLWRSSSSKQADFLPWLELTVIMSSNCTSSADLLHNFDSLSPNSGFTLWHLGVKDLLMTWVKFGLGPGGLTLTPVCQLSWSDNFDVSFLWKQSPYLAWHVMINTLWQMAWSQFRFGSLAAG